MIFLKQNSALKNPFISIKRDFYNATPIPLLLLKEGVSKWD